MTATAHNSELPATVQRRLRRYRLAALVILLLGLAGAGTVYWLGSRAADEVDDAAMLGFNRAAERQMGVLFGKQGQLISGVDNWLKKPGAQAFLVAAATAVIALGCFQFSRVLEFEAREAAAQGEPKG
ncbi:MAG TPA: hypothetical protein VL970_14080 [Candidatus Acidoferrales bacterium]|nr:hypothetical protein [Candidatus Acidoferrales bacterium]